METIQAEKLMSALLSSTLWFSSSICAETARDIGYSHILTAVLRGVFLPDRIL